MEAEGSEALHDFGLYRFVELSIINCQNQPSEGIRAQAIANACECSNNRLCKEQCCDSCLYGGENKDTKKRRASQDGTPGRYT